MNKLSKTTPSLFPMGLFACVLSIALACGCASKKAEESSETQLMKATFSVPMMCCTVCAAKTKEALEAFGGVDKAYANFLEKRAWARYDPNMVSPERMKKAIEALGLKDTTIESVGPWEPDPLPETS